MNDGADDYRAWYLATGPSVAQRQPTSVGELVEPAEVESRALANVRAYYDRTTKQYRSLRSTAMLLALVLPMMVVPGIPGGAKLMKVSQSHALWGYGACCFWFIVCALVHRRVGSFSIWYASVATAETVTWCAVNAALILASGTAESLFWLPLAMLVVMSATTLYRHHVVRRVLGSSLLVTVVVFTARGAWGDAVFSLVFGGSLGWFQHFGTKMGWRTERERARAEALADRASSILVDQERQRLARELHDGVASQLTSALWEARGLETREVAEVSSLVERIRVTLAELRSVTHRTRRRPLSPGRLADECERVAKLLVPRNVELLIHRNPEVSGCLEGFELPSEFCEDLLAILREALSNALHHGRPRQITVALGVDAGAACLEVSNDRGELNRQRLGRGGTGHIVERARARGGHASWVELEPGGTRLIVKLPVPIEGSVSPVKVSPNCRVASQASLTQDHPLRS